MNLLAIVVNGLEIPAYCLGVNLRPADGVLFDVMCVAGAAVLCYVLADLSDKIVKAAIVNFGEFKSSV